MKGRIVLCCLCLAVIGLCSAASAEAQSRYCRPRVSASRPVLRVVGRVVGTTVRGTRRVAGLGTQVVTELHPGVRIADAMGIVDRHRIVRIVRGF